MSRQINGVKVNPMRVIRSWAGGSDEARHSVQARAWQAGPSTYVWRTMLWYAACRGDAVAGRYAC